MSDKEKEINLTNLEILATMQAFEITRKKYFNAFQKLAKQ